jgi:hypothetical protein
MTTNSRAPLTVGNGFIVIAIIAIAVTILLAMGREGICECGWVKLWHGQTASSENSQHISDWYTFSHIIHGFVFYALFWWVGRKWTATTRIAGATLIEATWEVVENTPWIINRYREATIALDYYGDSVLNSTADICWMLVGYFVASRLPIWATVSLALAMEVGVALVIRDNLTLNVIMLVWPLDSIRAWQAGV